MTVEADLDRETPHWSFEVKPGADALQHFYGWLADLQDHGIIGAWHSAGTISDQRRTLALVEFEEHDHGRRALLAWPGPAISVWPKASSIRRAV